MSSRNGLSIMIYNDLLNDLEDLCRKFGIENDDVDLSDVMICSFCNEPFRPVTGNQKYCKRCTFIAEKKKKKEEYQRNKSLYKQRQEKYKARPRCTCCHENPIAEGNKFLCHRCYEWEGDGWREYDSQKCVEAKKRKKEKSI